MNKCYKHIKLKHIQKELEISLATYSVNSDGYSCCNLATFEKKFYLQKYLKENNINNYDKDENFTYVIFENNKKTSENKQLPSVSYIKWKLPIEKLAKFKELIEENLEHKYELLIPNCTHLKLVLVEKNEVLGISVKSRYKCEKH